MLVGLCEQLETCTKLQTAANSIYATHSVAHLRQSHGICQPITTAGAFLVSLTSVNSIIALLELLQVASLVALKN